MARYYELRESVFSLESLHARVDSLVEELGEDAINRNFEKYPILDQYIWPNRFIGGTHEAEIQYIKDWFGQRLEFMDAEITNTVDVEDLTEPILVFPNPNNGNFIIDLGKHAISSKLIVIYDAQGRVVRTNEVSYQNEVQYNLDLDSGIYFLRVLNTTGKTIGTVQKLIVY